MVGSYNSDIEENFSHSSFYFISLPFSSYFKREFSVVLLRRIILLYVLCGEVEEIHLMFYFSLLVTLFVS